MKWHRLCRRIRRMAANTLRNSLPPRPDPVADALRRQEGVRHDLSDKAHQYGLETEVMAMEMLKLRRKMYERPDDNPRDRLVG